METVEEGAGNAPESVNAESALAVEGGRGSSDLGRRVLLLMVGALVVGVSFWWMQFSTRSVCCGDFDAYYHFRWSQMLWDGVRTGNFPPAFTALPLTTLNADDYVDHHFLFHILQIPFTQFGDVEVWTAVLFALCLLASPLVYRLAARLLREGDWLLVSLTTSVLAGFAVAMALLQVRGGGAARFGIAVVALAVMFGCERLLARLLRSGRGRAVAALAAGAVAFFAPLLFYWAAILYRLKTGVPPAGGDEHADFHYGAKLGTWLFACLAVLSCYWLVVQYRLRYPVLWLLALLSCATPFLYRMNMGKAMSVSIVLLVAGIQLLFRRKYIWLLPLSFLFALTYDMFALLGVAAVVWAAVVLWSEGKLEWRPVVWVGLGSIAGFIINPYFPHNLELMFSHVAMKITAKDFSTAVGGEWYPYNTWEFVGNCFVACVAAFVGYVAFNGSDRRNSQRTLFFLIFSTFLLVVNLRWKRFAEYWPPFAVLFAAFSLQPVLEGARAYAGRLPEEVLDELRPFLDRGERPEASVRGRRARTLEYGLASAAGLVLAFGAVWAMSVTSNDIAGMAGPEQYRGGMEWIRKNVPEGEIIFNTDWDDFPKLFFYSSKHAYVSGLDPTYLHDRDKGMSDHFGEIGTGKVEDPGPPIRERFGARYVFTDNEHEDFVNLALDSGWFDEVYADDNSTVLRIRDTKGAPVPLPEKDDHEHREASGDEAVGGEDGAASDEEQGGDEGGNEP